MQRGKRTRLLLFLLIAGVVGLATLHFIPVNAQFRDVEQLYVRMTADSGEGGSFDREQGGEEEKLGIPEGEGTEPVEAPGDQGGQEGSPGGQGGAPPAQLAPPASAGGGGGAPSGRPAAGSPGGAWSVFPSWGAAGACRWPVIVRGGGIPGGARASLEAGGAAVNAVKTWTCGSALYAVFDLRGAAAGDYRLVAQSGGGKSDLGTFSVKAAACASGGTTEYPSAENGIAWEKGTDSERPGYLQVTLKQGLMRSVSRAYAVAPGVLLEGRVVLNPYGQAALSFNLVNAPQSRYDLVLSCAADWPILIEGVISPEDVVTVQSMPPAAPN